MVKKAGKPAINQLLSGAETRNISPWVSKENIPSVWKTNGM
jgi:hypothetical protein